MKSNAPVSPATADELSLDEFFNKAYEDTFTSVSRFVVSKSRSLLDSDDILQNVYARFFQRILKKGFSDIENVEAFIINIAKFECKTYFGGVKKKSNTTSFADYSEEQMVAIEAEMSKSEPLLEDTLCNSLLARQIFEDIATEDPLIGKIFYLHFNCDMKLDEVAKELNVSLSSVKNKLYRTIEKQKKKFKL